MAKISATQQRVLAEVAVHGAATLHHPVSRNWKHGTEHVSIHGRGALCSTSTLRSLVSKGLLQEGERRYRTVGNGWTQDYTLTEAGHNAALQAIRDGA